MPLSAEIRLCRRPGDRPIAFCATRSFLRSLILVRFLVLQLLQLCLPLQESQNGVIPRRGTGWPLCEDFIAAWHQERFAFPLQASFPRLAQKQRAQQNASPCRGDARLRFANRTALLTSATFPTKWEPGRPGSRRPGLLRCDLPLGAAARDIYRRVVFFYSARFRRYP